MEERWKILNMHLHMNRKKTSRNNRSENTSLAVAYDAAAAVLVVPNVTDIIEKSQSNIDKNPSD